MAQRWGERCMTGVERFRSLDALRGVAALWIVLFHVLDSHPGYGEVVYRIIRQGHLGVPIFLVISGFGIAASAERALAIHERPLTFLKTRLIRIYLPYLVSVVFVGCLLPLVFGLISALKGGAPSIPFPAYSIGEWVQVLTLTRIFAATNWMLNRPFLLINGAVWYLAIIVQIYLVVAVAMWCGRFYRSVLVGLTLLSASTLVPSIHRLLLPGLFLPFWLDFALGMALFYLIRNQSALLPTLWRSMSWHIPTIAVGALGLSLGLVEIPTHVMRLCITVILLLVYPFDERLSRHPLFRSVSFLGLFSYSLYLLHVPLEEPVTLVVRRFAPVSFYLTDPLFVIPMIVGLSYVWYLFFEKPGSWAAMAGALRHPRDTLAQRGVSQRTSP